MILKQKIYHALTSDSNFDETGIIEHLDAICNFVAETSQQGRDLWEALCKKLRELKHLKGSRLILDAMEVWASSINLFCRVFNYIPEKVICCYLEATFPVDFKKIKMTDRQTIYACIERLKQLNDRSKKGELTEDDKKEMKGIMAYLKETTFRGKIRFFNDEDYKTMKRNEQSVKYALSILEKTEPSLAAFAKAHLKTYPVIRWE